jgi:ABC-2 type transport system permease protein
MRQLVAAESLKLRTVRAPLTVLAVGFAAVLALLAPALLNAGKVGAPSLGTTANLRQILVAPGAGGLFLLVVGVLSTSGELRHHTATGVFLVTPRRTRVVAAKVLALALSALAFAAAAPRWSWRSRCPTWRGAGSRFTSPAPNWPSCASGRSRPCLSTR